MNHLSENERRMSRVLAINFVALVVLVVLPAGGYQAHGATIKVSSLSPPFADYGVFLATSAVFLALFVIAARLYGHRRRVSPLGYVIAAGGVLGFMVPDIITSSNRTIAIGARERLVQVDLLVGFWLTLVAAVLLFAIASVAFFAESNARNVDRRASRSDTQTLERT